VRCVRGVEQAADGSRAHRPARLCAQVCMAYCARMRGQSTHAPVAALATLVQGASMDRRGALAALGAGMRRASAAVARARAQSQAAVS